jgi:hypothetical protein
MLLESSIMFLESSIMLLELSIMLPEIIYCTGITHDDRNMFIVQAIYLNIKTHHAIDVCSDIIGKNYRMLIVI